MDEKELMEEQIAEDLKNANRELEGSTKSLEEHKETYDLWVKVVESLEEAAPIIINKCRRLPGKEQFEYELEDAYWENMKSNMSLDVHQKLNEYKEKRLPQIEKVIAAKEEAVKSLQEKIDRMTGGKDE